MASFEDRLNSLINFHGSIDAVAEALGVNIETVERWESGNITGADVNAWKAELDSKHADIMADDEDFSTMTINAMTNKRDEKRETIHQAYDEGSIDENRYEAELERFPEVEEEEIEGWEYLLETARETDDPEDWANFRNAYGEV